MIETRPRAVVDTNLFVSGTILKRGNPYRLLLAWRASAFTLLLTGQQREELEDVFGRPAITERYRINQTEVEELRSGFDAAEPVVPSEAVPVYVRDPKDVKILAAALGGGADYLVTGDQDLLVLGGNPLLGSLSIVTVAEFLRILGDPATVDENPG